MMTFMQQHLRALKSMGYEPSGSFVTSILELKLALFEWQKHNETSTSMPHYQDLLNLRAQALETSISNKEQPKSDAQFSKKTSAPGKFITSFAASTSDPGATFA